MKTYDDPSFRNLPNDIQQLFSEAGSSSFFNTAGWYDLVARFGMRQGWKPHFVTDDAARSAFILETPMSRVPREFVSLTNPYSCEHAILDLDGAAGTLATEIARGNPRKSHIRLNGLVPTDPAFAATVTALRGAHYAVRPFFCWGNWHENVANMTFDEYLAARPSILSSTWKRKTVAVQKNSRADFQVYEPGSDVEPFLTAYAQVEAQSWKEQEPFPEFIPELIRHASAIGALQFGILRIEDEPAAAQFWVLWRQKALIFKLAYSTKFRSFSPGTLLTMHMVRHILTNCEVSEIDFGRGDDDYKKLWCSSRRERWGIDAANPRTFRGAILAAHNIAGSMRDRYLRREAAR
jgi:hypothetical protein